MKREWVESRPDIGVLQWFHLGEHDRVERTLADLAELGVRHLRTGISWADWNQPEGPAWYDWLLPRLARELDVLPCFLYTPPSLGIVPATSSPPRVPKDYADYLDVMITRYGRHFEWVELWNEPNNLSEWDWTHDPGWQTFSEMVIGAAYWARQRGKRTLLGGASPIDPRWFRIMCERGVMEHIDAVGIHGFPGTWEASWPKPARGSSWTPQVQRVRDVLDEHGVKPAIWITETGYSTWKHDDIRQVQHFLDVLDAPVERAYWYSLYDLQFDRATVDGMHSDEREYHFGIKHDDGTPKLLYRLWAEDSTGRRVRELAATVGDESASAEVQNATRNSSHRTPRTHALVTGGAGFIGVNLADRLLRDGRRVLIYDNLSRDGVLSNLRWLKRKHGDRFKVRIADVRDRLSLREALTYTDEVYHFAAQVAVTSSLRDPMHDFDVNARGTLNLLEELRVMADPPPLLFTSTNKVYGPLDTLPLRSTALRHEPADERERRRGIDESRCLDFHSPYGCSKGFADQLVRDYARSYGLRTVVFRMSCIYGPHQCGNEDQGWVAHFLLRALRGGAISLYGDGRQVRDLLFIDDLLDAMMLARQQFDALAGSAFNIGGGPRNTASLLELIELIEQVLGEPVEVAFREPRGGDQLYYASDHSQFTKLTRWSPRIGVEEGVERLYNRLSGRPRTARVAVAAEREEVSS